MNPFILLIVIYAAVFLSSPLIAVFHELGHAFAYLIFTKPERIDIYIGSYGDVKKSISFRAGKLHFFIKKSFPFVKGIGVCGSSQRESDYRKFVVILLAGPVFTLLAAGIIAIIVFSANANLLIQIFCYIFLGFSTLSLIGNLVPREIVSANGLGLNSDGNQIIYTLKLKESLPDYNQAVNHYINKEYNESIIWFKKALEAKPRDVKTVRFLIFASFKVKQYDDIAVYITILEHSGEFSVEDMLNKACLQSVTHQSDEAILTYQQVLKKEKHNLLALNNVASELVDKGAYIVAQRALDKIIKIKPNYVYAYNTMAYSQIMQGDIPGAKTLIDKCFALSPDNAYVYKTLGIYYLKLKNADEAAVCFNKVFELDKSIEFAKYSDELKLLIDTGVTS
jgi:hypothetical protein